MAEKSTWWTTGATGDGASEYTQAEMIRVWRQQWIGDDTDEGTHKDYQNELEVTGTASPVQIDTGAAVVFGFPYWNTAAENKTIPTPVASIRIDRIVLKADWTAQTVRIVVLSGNEGGGAPALTQSDGVTWEISLAQVSITTGGVITVTDERVWLHPSIGVDETMLDASVAGDGLIGGDGSALAVNPGAGLEISSDAVRIAAAAAGDGLQGGAGAALAVDVSDFAGAGLEDDGSENLRIAAAAGGDGIQGGGGSPLAVDVSDFAGQGLEADGAENLRVAAAAAGDGLTGGGGAALAVNAGHGIEISSDFLRIAAEAAGDGLAGGAGAPIDVDVSEFAGTGLQDDGSNNLRIAAAAAGDGLQGGGAVALAIDVFDFAGAGLEDDGSENLRIAAAAAGAGLSGGEGQPLAVNPDDSTIEVVGDEVRVKDDGVDDTKVGDRVPQFYRRQGGDATHWTYYGTTNYTPGAVRMQAGSIEWTGTAAATGGKNVDFPVAFSGLPLVFVSAPDDPSDIIAAPGVISVSGVSIYWRDVLSNTHTSVTLFWLAIGPE